jgi:hypothetical protein
MELIGISSRVRNAGIGEINDWISKRTKLNDEERF